jgi:hypothetical protein
VVLVVLGVMLTPVVLAATRVRLSAGRAAALLAGAQLGIHLSLHAMHPVTGSATAMHHVHGGDAAVLASAHASGALGASAEMVGMAHMGGFLGLTPVMLLAHTVATVMTAWLVARGEALLWAVVATLLPRLPRPVRLPRRGPSHLTLPPQRLREAVRSGPLGSRAPPPAPA